MKLEMKIVSSLEKCFVDEPLSSKREQNRFIMFHNERLSFQVIYRADDPDYNIKRWSPIRLSGALADYATVRLVGNVLNMFPTYNLDPGGEFLRTDVGAYPDLLRPLIYPNAVSLPHQQTHALWIDVELPEDHPAGTFDLSLAILNENKPEEVWGQVRAEVQVLSTALPPQELIHTEWFYTDSIANHYHVKPFSEKHWKYIESYLRTATRNGINMILTPLFTPELDTYIGGERLTTQLVDIELTDGKFRFGFDKLHRWIDLCLACGVKYFEIPHFFTQWGAKAAPKIIVKVNGRRRKYFGWHTDSMGPEYADFLDQFIPAILAEFKARGLDHNCFFHVSDEPHLDQIDQYRRCKELIGRHLKGYPIIDALSNFDFYSEGILEKPVPHTRGAMPFIEAGVEGLWVYYCGGGKGGVSDRSISMPAHRTRMLGLQLYYYNIEGFLHWGYNFYGACNSYNVLDPFGYPDGGYFTPAGDCFLVYPGTDGTAWESLRINALRQGIDDMRALRLYEERFGREATEALILEGTDGTLDFVHYPTVPDYLPRLRERIAAAFADK